MMVDDVSGVSCEVFGQPVVQELGALGTWLFLTRDVEKPRCRPS